MGVRRQCRNVHWFLGLEDCREKLEDWRRDHNEVRPYRAIGGGGLMQNPIDTVLKAERQAEAVIQSRRDQARTTINEAMKVARAISRRTQQRIATIHNQCTAQVNSVCEEMLRDCGAVPHDTSHDATRDERLAKIAARVAAQLTGGRDV